MSTVVILPAHWHDLAELWPPATKARHARLAAELLRNGFDEPTSQRLAAERVLADIAEAHEHQEQAQ